MNIVLTKIYAAASAQFCGRSSFVRNIAVGCALGCAALSAAQAGEHDRDRERDGQRYQPQQVQPAPRDGGRNAAPMPQQRGPEGRDARQYDQRAFEARAEEQRRQQQMQQDQNAHEARRSGRLTPDERRDLRRQINEVGQDLYPQTPRR